VRFEIITAESMKISVFWVVAPAITLMIDAASTSETSVNFYWTTQRKNSEDSHINSTTIERGD
jgi:hypothetical protein